MKNRDSRPRKPTRRRVLCAAFSIAGVAGMAGVCAPVLAADDAWPSRPIRLIVPYPPGGPVDQLGRVIAPKLGEKLGQTVVVENKSRRGRIDRTRFDDPGDARRLYLRLRCARRDRRAAASAEGPV